MKKIISLVISFTMIISYIPFVVFASDVFLGTKDNPIVIDADNPYAFFEAEDYPVVNQDSSNYKIVSDSDASGGNAIRQLKAISYDELTTKGDAAQYRLYIKAVNEGKIKIFLRIKLNESSDWADARTTKITCAKNDDPLMDRTHYIEEQGKYYWVCSDSYEVSAGEEFSFSMIFSSARNSIDKFFITSDLQKFPVGKENEISDNIDFSYCKDYYNAPTYDPRNEHPRIFINSDNLNMIKSNMEAEENEAAYSGLVEKANTEPTSYTFQNSVNYILSNAFLAVVGEVEEQEQRALNAKNALLESLKLKSNLSTDRSLKENMNKVIYRLFVLAIVYDWCYDYIEDVEKDILVSNMLFYMAQQEYTYPPLTVSGVNNGHESEGDIFVGHLFCALAIYDEYPDMYRTVGGKIFQEMIPARNYYYEMGNHTQGTHYNAARMIYEFYLKTILESGVKSDLLSDNADKILMEYIYGLRPDNRIMRNGDHNASGSSAGLSTNPNALFYYANYYNNPYLKNEYKRVKPTPSFSSSLTSVNEVLWLIFNNPEVGTKDFNNLPHAYYTGDKAGVMYLRTSWDEGDNAISDAMTVRLNLETIYGGGHDHLDAGHFDIYYKGSLALDSGFYTGISTDHHRNYYKRTVAHNSMLLYDTSEVMTQIWPKAVNDGGQRFKTPNVDSVDTLYENQKIGEILAVDYGEDMYNPSFAYMKGDLTGAYAPEKMKNYTRSFVYLNFFDDVYPGALIVFDKMTSKNPDFKKTWLLHTQEEPQIIGNTVIAKKTEEGDNGRLINTTLLPKQDDAYIEPVGGKDMMFSTNGISYPYTIKNHFKDYGEWRIELSPKTQKATDYFLNVLHVTENDNSIELLQPELIEFDGFAGVKIKDRVALLSLDDTLKESEVTFTVSGDEEYEILVTGLKAGEWNISKDGISYQTVLATENGNDLVFEGEAGQYTLYYNAESTKTLTRNLDYENYINESDEEYSYIKFNDVYHSAPFFEENSELYVGAEYISEYLDAELEITSDSLIYYNDEYSTKVLKNSDDIILKDGIYYVSPYALRDIFYVKWVKENDNIYNLTISKREIVKITNGTEFENTAFTDSSALYIIEGEDVLPDKTCGIKLSETYASKSDVAGVIKGIDNKNNICLTSGKPLFTKSYETDYISFDNLILKGTGVDGSGNIISDSASTGVLVTDIINYSDYKNNFLSFKNIINYVGVSYSDYKDAVCYVGGLVGFVRCKDTYVDGCVNYGNTDARNTKETRGAGGFVGSTRNGKTTIVNSVNEGDVWSNGATGGLHGYSYLTDGGEVIINISNCANHGDITSTSQNSTGGLLGNLHNGKIEKSYNSGDVTGLNGASGIIAKVASGNVTISDSYNTGDINITTSKSGYYTCGIAYKASGTLNISNCHNVGNLRGKYSKEIANSADSDENNYYINEVAGEQPVGRFTNPVNVIGTGDIFQSESENEENKIIDPDSNKIITAPYFIVPARFSFLLGLNIEDAKYGILLSETVSGEELKEDTCDIEIEAKRNVLGNFGILVHGNKVISGKKYNTRPYVKYKDKYYYGTPISFVFKE